MPRISKKSKIISAKVEQKKYSVIDAVKLFHSLPKANFIERLDVVISLGVDMRKSDQIVRSSSILPHGSGKSVRVAAFVQGENAVSATQAGADVVGYDDLLEDIKGGKINFDVLLTSPSDMAKLSRLGPVLGPRGLMPNPRLGTVSKNIGEAVANAKSKQVRYKTDKNGLVHCSVGNINFSADDIYENLLVLFGDLKKNRPVNAKGVYFKSMFLSTTMGPSIEIDIASVSS